MARNPQRNTPRNKQKEAAPVTQHVDDTPNVVAPKVTAPAVNFPPPVENKAIPDAEGRRTPAEQRLVKAQTITAALKDGQAAISNASDNPALAKVLGQDTGLPKPAADRPAIFDTIDATVQPFILEMMPTTRTSDARAGELHYSMSTLIKMLLNAGGNDLKVGAPYLFAYYRKYASSVFHPQNHHRGVGAMRGTDADIDFYRNISRIFVDLSTPDSARLTLERTDIARFRNLTLSISSPAAQRMSENLVTLISRLRNI